MKKLNAFVELNRSETPTEIAYSLLYSTRQNTTTQWCFVYTTHTSGKPKDPFQIRGCEGIIPDH